MNDKMRRQDPIWLFDLDNTLHDASHAIFPAINLNMNAHIAQVLRERGLSCEADAVNAKRIGYWRRYGATLIGMVNHHQVKPANFLREAHRFDDLSAMIRTERGLARLLHKLPGRMIVLTNAPRRYAHDVLRHIGLHRNFAQHVPIEAIRVHGRLRSKPSRLMLCRLLARERLPAGRCILVENTAVNLKAAHALGLRTAWVIRYLATDVARHMHLGSGATAAATTHPIYVDVKVKSVGQLFRQLHRLR